MNKLDFFIDVMKYSAFVIIGFTLIMISSIGLAFIPISIQYVFALSVGIILAIRDSKKRG